MRRFYSIVCLMFVALYAIAQTADSPLTLQAGANTYLNSAFQNRTVVYYSYTNASDSDQVLILYKVTPSTSFVAHIGDELAVHSEQNGADVIEIAKGKSALVEVTSYSKTTEFNARTVTTQLTERPINLPVSGTDVYLPSGNGNATETVYTAQQTGLLCIAFNHAQTSYPTWRDENGNSGSIGYVSDFDGNQMYCAKMLVIEGQKYTISFTNAVPDLLTIRVEDPADGTTVDGPFEGVVGDTVYNVLPAAAGHYWYMLDRDQYIGHRFMIFSSDANLQGGSMRVYTSTTDSQPTYSSDNYLRGRMHIVVSNKNYYIRVEKPTSTETDEKFQITFDNELLPEDSVSTCPEIQAGQSYNVPDYNGTYYYSIRIPSDNGTQYLVIDGGEAAKHSTIQVGPSYQYETYLAKGTNGYVRCAVNAGQSYIVTVKANEGINNWPFSVSYAEIQPGEVESQPITAKQNEEYTIPANETRYYYYVPTSECWINAQISDLDAEVSFKKCGYNNITVGSERVENIQRLRASEGEAYIIVVKAANADVILKIFEETRGTGESADQAVEVSDGETTLASDKALDMWYVYTVKSNGMLSVESNIEYESDPMNPTKGSDVTVRLGSKNATPESILSYDSNWNMVYAKEFAVTEGELVYINVKTYSAQADKYLRISEREYAEGESPLKPKTLLFGENTLPAANYMAGYIWYAIDLLPGAFSITQPESQSFNFDMYAEGDYENKIATTQSEGEIGSLVYSLNYKVTTAGRYLLQLTKAVEGEKVIVNGVGDGISEVDNESVKSDNRYNLAGQKITATQKGIVIVNGKKIIVK